MNVTLWGEMAHTPLQEGQIIAIKNAKISDFNGKSLNSGDDTSTIIIEPKHQRTQELIKWYSKV